MFSWDHTKAHPPKKGWGRLEARNREEPHYTLHWENSMEKLKIDPLVVLHRESRKGAKLEEDHEFSCGHVHSEVLWGY